MRNLIRSDAAGFRVPIAIPGCKVVGVFLATIARLRQMVACFRRSFRFGGAGRKHKLCKILFDGSLKRWPDASATKPDKTTFTHTAGEGAFCHSCIAAQSWTEGIQRELSILVCIFHLGSEK